MTMPEIRTRYGIPVGPEGYVPEEELLKHYQNFYRKRQQEYDSKRVEQMLSGGKRMPNINLAKRDYDNTSDDVIPLESTPEQVARWWHDPTSCDIEDIDTAGAPKINIPKDMTSEQKRNQGKIKVISTPAEEQKLRRELVMTYSPEDLTRFANAHPTIAVKPTGVGYSGRYVPARTLIEVDRKDGLNQGTIAHEGGHLLRDRDPDRADPIVTKNPIIGIEESCTVAEQMARSDKPDYTGYYRNVAVYDDRKHVWRRPTVSEARRMAEEDHMLFTYGRGKGLKGDDALRSVQENWPHSHIARLRHGSPKMAINEMADVFGGVDRISMAKPRTKTEAEQREVSTVTNATAGRPGVAVVANGKTVQTTLFRRRGR